jgi:Trm5-related predicted tRNA methylase
MDNIFDLDVVDFNETTPEAEEAIQRRLEAHEQARIEGIIKWKEQKKLKEASKVHVSKPEAVAKNAWWWSLTEEEKVVYRQNKKQEVLEGNERLKQAMLDGVNLCVDLSWDCEHSVRERQSLCKQLSLTYGHLKIAPKTMHLHITSVEPDSAVEKGLHTQGILNWFATTHQESPCELFDNSRIIILSPDAETPLETVDLNKVRVCRCYVCSHHVNNLCI